jgi:hypothetical protein
VGSSGANEAGDPIAIDDSGNAYATGTTDSADFPATDGAFQAGIGSGIGAQGGLAGEDDAFVVKLLAEGLFWGDVDCSGGVSVLDGRKVVLAAVGNPAAQPNDCPDITGDVVVNDTDLIWGDVDCSGTVTVVDGRKIVLAAVGSPANQPGGCPFIGELIELG